MRPQILFFDVDGTISSDITRTIPASAVEAINLARENGHQVFINSGRTLASVNERGVLDIPFDGLLLGCGTRIIYRGETLLAKTFTGEEGARILDALKKHHIEAFLEGSEDIYVQREPYIQPEMDRIRKSFKALGFSKQYMEDGNIPFDKFCMLEHDKAKASAFFDDLRDLISPIDRERGIYECLPVGFTKATAMKTLMAHLGIEASDTWAFGDSSNDIPMFETAGHRVAMGKHSRHLEPFADHIADTVENDGLYKIMKEIGFF